MKVIDLTKQHENEYFLCLEDWSDELKEAGDHKKCWYEKMKDKGLRVKLVINNNGIVGGMIQYVPIEHSFVEGKDLYFINCIWVHGHKKGRGNFQKKGMGTALLKACEEDVRSMGKKGVAAWGITMPFFMRSSWFKKHGYLRADRIGMSELLYKPFSDDVVPPKWMKVKKKPLLTEGKVTITLFKNGWCSAKNLIFERVKRAAFEYKDDVVLNVIDTFERDTFLEWGISDALYVDDKEIGHGPPPSYKKICKIIKRRIKQRRKFWV